MKGPLTWWKKQLDYPRRMGLSSHNGRFPIKRYRLEKLEPAWRRRDLEVQVCLQRYEYSFGFRSLTCSRLEIQIHSFCVQLGASGHAVLNIKCIKKKLGSITQTQANTNKHNRKHSASISHILLYTIDILLHRKTHILCHTVPYCAFLFFLLPDANPSTMQSWWRYLEGQ